jgi:hypothetical protein
MVIFRDVHETYVSRMRPQASRPRQDVHQLVQDEIETISTRDETETLSVRD